MYKVLRVGDPHVTADALDDSQKLLDLILETARTNKVKRIEFLGDQYHTHALINVHVMAFWQRNFGRLKEAGFEVLCLVGNHDMPGDGSATTSMLAHPDVLVVDKPTVLDGVVYVPYTVKEEDFIKACDSAYRSGVDVVVAHQSFFGATYENGFPCEDGFNPSAISQGLIISGHIHRPQELVGRALDGSYQKVWYIGAPRWRTAADANTERNIWVMEHENDGTLVNAKPVPTGDVCRQIFQYEDTPEKPLLLRPSVPHSYIIDIKGPLAFIEDRKKLWSFARVRTFNTDTAVSKVKESEGIEKAWTKYLAEFKAPNGTPYETLKAVAAERLSFDA